MYNYPPPGYPPPPYGYSAPTPRKPLWPWVLGGAALLVVLMLGVVVVVVVMKSSTGEKRRAVTMTYQVEGTARTARVSYKGPTDSDENQDVSLPWSADVVVGGTVVMAGVTVTTLEPGATVECRVLANGRQVAHNGPSPMIVSCLGETGNPWPTPTRSRYRN
ncbi:MULTISPECIES: hypothetical protein [Mycobacterium]|jgi:hypothetical protein|uniref:hypothetical protein n=1 Tax=Mycobacterium TaxID=1763 RepID=UPI000AE9390F|nr:MULTISPECIES: hypothetical protein [Mycobacterium]MBI2703467.1 hypothetical protein [Mycobacterium sp.]MCQ4361445.1 hypothetical protein [Mycobacterium gordonae]MCV7010700.1 hypothetical protein [Mycobacterium gordonae]